MDANSSTDVLCNAGSDGKHWGYANKFDDGETVAGALVSAEGIMQVGQDCATGPNYILDSSSCIKDTTFDADIDAGTAVSAVYAANMNYHNSDSGMNGKSETT